MAEKTFNARLKLKYDSHENWVANDPVLLQGEVALSVVNVKQEGTVNEVPSVLIKVGDGTHKYSELGFTYAKAADVLPEAKSTESLTTFINNVIKNAGIATDEALNTLSGKITTAEGKITALKDLVGDTAVATQIQNAITALNLDGKYDAKGSAAAVQSDLNTYKASNDAAVAAAKKAGDDAQSTIDAYKVSNDARVQAVEDAINGAETFEPLADTDIDALFA